MEELTLFPSWPNPVNGTATIAFQVHRTQPITLRLYDARGAMVHELANGRHVPGRYAFTYDTSPLKAGPYRWELRSGTTVRTQGMVVE